jgi:acetyl esterase
VSGVPLRDRLAVGVFRVNDARGKRRGTRATPEESARKPLADRLGGKPPAFVSRPGPTDLRVVEHQLPGGGSLRCYRPATEAGQARPALLFMHGGGWIWGSSDVFDPLLRRAVGALDAVVVSVDYRLAPGHPFPAAVDDVVAALAWLRAEASPLGVDVARVAVMGESAGANLAAVVALHDRDQPGGPPLVGQVLVYPLTDMTMGDDWARDYRGPGLTTEDCRQLVALYLAGAADHRNPLASPLHAETLSGLPPALVITAELDPLRDQGRGYARRLAHEGVVARCVDFPGVPHGFFGGDRLLVSARRAQQQALDELRLRYREGQPT